MTAAAGPARRRGLLLLFAAVAALRVGLLLLSQRGVCGDEAAVGVLAHHILEQRERPVFAYHERYNGGAALTAYAAAIAFSQFGSSEVVLKLVPLVLSLLALLAVYALARSARDEPTALLVTAVYGTSVMLLKWSFDARGGYAEGQLLVPLMLWLLYARCLRPEGGTAWDDLGLGLLCGFGVYVFPLLGVAALLAFGFLLWRSWTSRSWRGLALWCAGALAGAFPLLYYGADTAPVSGGDAGALVWGLAKAPWVLLRGLAWDLPRAMAYDNLDDFPPLRLFPNAVEFAACGVAIVFLLWRRRAALGNVRLLLRQGSEQCALRVPLEAILFAYVGLYFALYALHPRAGEEARHLLFLEPVLSILTGLGCAELLGAGAESGRAHLRRWAVALLALLGADRAVQIVRLAADDGIYGPLGRSDPRLAGEMLRFLADHRIDHIMSEDWDLSWRVVFESGERIKATHSSLWLGRLLREQPARRGEHWALVMPPVDAAEQVHVRKRLARQGLLLPQHVAERDVYLLEVLQTTGQAAP